METGGKKDFWDKLKIGAFIAIPIVVAIVGGMANYLLKGKDVEVRMVELAVGILKEDPQDNPKITDLRKWATSTINEYSKIKLTKKAIEELEEKPLPKTVTFGRETATMTPSTAFSIKALEALKKSRKTSTITPTELSEAIQRELEKFREENIKP